MSDLNLFRRMNHTFRLNGKPTIKPYSLSEHSFQTALLFEHFADLEQIDYGTLVLSAILKHDVIEVLTGDLPYPVKNLTPETKEAWKTIEKTVATKQPLVKDFEEEKLFKHFSSEQFNLFKACDLLELYMFCQEEQTLGNISRSINDVCENCFIMLTDLQSPLYFKSIVDYIYIKENKI